MKVILPGERQWLAVSEIIDLLAEQSVASFCDEDRDRAASDLIQNADGTWVAMTEAEIDAQAPQRANFRRLIQEREWTKNILAAVNARSLSGRDASNHPTHKTDDGLNLKVDINELSSWLTQHGHTVESDKNPIEAEGTAVQCVSPAELDDEPASKGQPIPTTTIKHLLDGKELRLLDAEIALARQRAINADDYHSVWSELVKMALAAEGCFVEFSTTLQAAKYRTDKGIMPFTKENLRDRMRREAKKKMEA